MEFFYKIDLLKPYSCS